ncbi:MAG: hypothetical protein ACHQ3P_10550 [Candidatus Limnocylindrales bacterium]
MDSRTPAEVAPPPEAIAFVRFCYRRRHAGWPELYDEMCAVASRRLYNGWGFTELTEHGIGFSLFETPSLAILAQQVVREEAERRRHVVIDVVAGEALPTAVDAVSLAATVVDDSTGEAIEVAEAIAANASPKDGPGRADAGPTPILRLAGAPAG